MRVDVCCFVVGREGGERLSFVLKGAKTNMEVEGKKNIINAPNSSMMRLFSAILARRSFSYSVSSSSCSNEATAGAAAAAVAAAAIAAAAAVAAAAAALAEAGREEEGRLIIDRGDVLLSESFLVLCFLRGFFLERA